MTEPQDHTPPTVAIIGLGEAGRAIAADLVAAGVKVTGWDPVVQQVPGVNVAANAADAVRSTAAVLSVNSAKAARQVVTSVLPALAPHQLFADLNTSSPGLKQELNEMLTPSGAEFVDVTLMKPVPGNGLRTPSLASGPGARRFVELMGGLGMTVELVGEEPGLAAARKLLRSILIKGMHGAFLEGHATAERLGLTDWYLAEVGASFDGLNAAAIDRILKGSRAHAVRRTDEMEAAADLVREAGLTPRASVAAAEILRELAQATKENA